ncbi:MAG TPA: hypothetical protein PLA83_00930 [Deltaproteobacteria bacterium]|jgi:AcrR family transcriptional regulator|nr:hypothetical protein [Deltaproteobacteria bacterium]HQI00560.1 hypothetical protein [Deltaproteobacteria bacterium]HQJ09329.1 hypothetical protein [Deltaproteobacteria bacterium]
MPVKSKFSAEDIIEAAFSIARTHGSEKFSARSIAGELKSSTMPIYSCLSSMKELEEAVLKKALDLLITYETKSRTGDIFLDMGIGYIMFAMEERHLFRMLFLSEKREGFEETKKRFRKYVIDILLDKLDHFEPMRGYTREQKRVLIDKMWIFTHGLAVLLNHSIIEDLSEKRIADLLTDTGIFVVVGERMRDEIYSNEDVKGFLERTGFKHLNKLTAKDFELF